MKGATFASDLLKLIPNATPVANVADNQGVLMSRVEWVNLGVFFGGILVAGLALILYDCWRAVSGGREATISHAMYQAGLLAPALPFVCGAVGAGLLVGLGIHFWGR